MAFMTFHELAERGLLVEGRMVKAAQTFAPGRDVFLAHSTADADYVRGAVRFFAEHEVSVYVDKLDAALPKRTSPQTAESLRVRIETSRRLVVMVSDNSRDSRWVPWELGLAHGMWNTVARIALFPISATASEKGWATQEYLGLYTTIIYEQLQGHHKACWAVRDPRDDKCWTLEQWLRWEVS